MALLGNYHVFLRSPLNTITGLFVPGRLPYGQPGAVKSNSFSQYAAIPSGTTPPYSLYIAQKSGMIASFTDLNANGSIEGQINSGINILANLDATISTTLAELGLIVSLLADLTASGTLTAADLAAVANLSASITASGTITTADLGAIVSLLADLNAAGNLVANNFATALLEANISSNTELSPQSLASAVWSATAADFNENGTMGEKLNDAGSASNPWTEVIESGLTAAEIMRIILAVQTGKTTIVDTGGGTATVTFRDVDDSKNRVSADMDGSERIDVTLDGT